MDKSHIQKHIYWSHKLYSCFYPQKYIENIFPVCGVVINFISYLKTICPCWATNKVPLRAAPSTPDTFGKENRADKELQRRSSPPLWLSFSMGYSKIDVEKTAFTRKMIIHGGFSTSHRMFVFTPGYLSWGDQHNVPIMDHHPRLICGWYMVNDG